MPGKPRQMAFSEYHARTAAKNGLFVLSVPEMTEPSGLQPLMLIKTRVNNQVCRLLKGNRCFQFHCHIGD